MENPVSIEQISSIMEQEDQPSEITAAFSQTDVHVVQVQLPKGRRDFIKVRERDNPNKVASEFCKKYKLNSDLEAALSKHIVENRVSVDLNHRRSHSTFLVNKSRMLSPQIPDRFLQQDKEFQPKINSNSGKILSKTERKPVHERLYRHSKSNKKVNQQTNENRKRKSEGSYGALLYVRGMTHARQKSRKTQNDTNEKSQEQYSFTPTINAKSVVISPRYLKKKRSDVLIDKGAEIKKKLAQLVNTQKKEEMSNCSFKPVLSPKSERLMSNKKSKKPHYERMFAQASKKKEVVRKITVNLNREQWPFSPRLNSAKSKIKRQETKEAFVERLHTEKAAIQAQCEEIREKEKQVELQDAETGQEFFKPIISRGPQEPRDKNIPLWEQLYREDWFKRARSQSYIGERDLMFLTMSSISNISETSQIVHDGYKRKIIRKYFYQCFIEVPEDGLLTLDNFQINQTVNPHVQKALQTIKNDLQTIPSMGFPMFYNKMDIYCDNISQPERASILQRSSSVRRKMSNEAIQEKPMLGDATVKLALSKQRNKDVVERLMLSPREKAQWLKEELEKKDEEEMEACTFVPKVALYTISEHESTAQSKKITEARANKDVFSRLGAPDLGWGKNPNSEGINKSN